MKIFGSKNNANVEVLAPHSGKIKALESLKDGVFSKKMLGDGVVIEIDKKLKSIDILSPIDGYLITAFPTGHAFGIRSKSRKEILIHIGIDTVNLKGKGFEVHVIQNQKVKAGSKLVTVDLEYIRKNVPLLDTIILVTSGEEITNLSQQEKIDVGENLFRI